MSSFRKYLKVTLLSLPLLVGAIWLLIIYRSPVYIISDHANTLKMDLVTEYDSNQPHSTINIISHTKDHLQFKYVLNSGSFVHFTRVLFSKSNQSLLNLSGYQLMQIKIRANKGRRLQVGIVASDGRPYISNISIDSLYQEVSIPLDKILTSYWWFANNNKKSTELPLQDLSKIKSFVIANCLLLDYGIEDVVDVQEWSFKFDIRLFFIKWLGISCIYYLAYSFVFYFTRKIQSDKVNRTIDINYEKLVLPDTTKSNLGLVQDYLKENFVKEDLSIGDVQLATGLPERKISALIKDLTGYNFKAYLNHLRLEAAKELLQNTDLPIADIAFRVGYSHVTHFNRVFKANINCSPKDYRSSIK